MLAPPFSASQFDLQHSAEAKISVAWFKNWRLWRKMMVMSFLKHALVFSDESHRAASEGAGRWGLCGLFNTFQFCILLKFLFIFLVFRTKDKIMFTTLKLSKLLCCFDAIHSSNSRRIPLACQFWCSILVPRCVQKFKAPHLYGRSYLISHL